MKVTQYMTPAANAQTATPTTSLLQISKQLFQHDFSCVVIVEGTKPIGQ